MELFDVGERQLGAVERQRGGSRQQLKKIDQEMKRGAVEIVEGHPAFTLTQILEELFRRLPEKPRISLTSLANILDGQFISVKKLEDAPTDRNRFSVKEERRDFALWLTTEGINQNLVYVDESGFNLFIRRTRGRARIGQRAVRQVLNSRGKNLNLLLAIGPISFSWSCLLRDRRGCSQQGGF